MHNSDQSEQIARCALAEAFAEDEKVSVTKVQMIEILKIVRLVAIPHNREFLQLTFP